MIKGDGWTRREVRLEPSLGRLDLAENPNVNEGEGGPTGASPSASDARGAPSAPGERVVPTTLVRYGHMGLIGEFTSPPQAKYCCGAKVVIQTDRGIELGEAVSLTSPGCENPIRREQILRYVEVCGPEYLRLNGGRILREATYADLAEDRHLRQSEKEKMEVCRRFIEARGLPMKLVDCEHLFGGERVVFYFMSEGRVDFRELVRDLAREFQTRIEMRQVGARDEARLVADFETCGRECCCKNFLKTLKPVNMKMAKMQKATLDPSKVSGRCGRLKCCLRYEQDTYEELDKRLPRTGTRVRTQFGDGTIVERQILTQTLLLHMDDNQRIAVRMDDVLSTDVPPPPAPSPAEAANGGRGRRAPLDRSAARRLAPAGPSGADSVPAGDGAEQSAGGDERSAPSGERRGRRRRRGRRSEAGPVGPTNDAGAPPESPAGPVSDEPDRVD